MMDFVRTHFKDSIVGKLFLGILAVSFGIWGVGDFVGTPGLDPSIAVKVGKTQVRAEEFARRYNRELDRLRQSLGPDAAERPGIKRSVASSVISDITTTATLDGAGQDFGITITDDRLRNEIRNEPTMKDPSGTFSPLLYQQLLRDNGMTEGQFTRLYASDLRRATVLKPVLDAAVAPKVLIDSLITYRGETRTIETLFIPASALTLPGQPSEDDLKQLYGKNVAAFTAPEYRKVTAIVLTTAALTHPENIEEAEVKKYYDENAERYHDKEKRHVVQLVFDTEQKAAEVRGKAAAGDTLETLASKTNSGPVVDLGDLTADSPLAANLPAAMILPAKEISQPIKSDLGWHLLEVTAITPPAVIPYDPVKDSIRKSLADDKALDAVSDASVQLEDGLANGTPLPEIAKNTGGKLVQIEAIDVSGNDPQGKPVADLPDREAFLRNAFSTAVGADSGLKNLAARNGYYVVHVDSVTPPTAKPFDTVRTEVVAMWERQSRATQAQELAEKVAKDVTATTNMAALEASDKRLSYASVGPIRRTGQPPRADVRIDGRRVSSEVLDKMFAAKVGDVFSAPVIEGMVVARVKEIAPPSAAELAEAESNGAKQLKNAIQSDLAEQMTRALAQRFPVEVNAKLIDQTVGDAR